MILNRQRTVRVARPPLELFLRRVREQLDLGSADVAVCLVSDAEIAHMNETFRKKQGPTDVLSFPAVARRKPVPLRNRNRHTAAAAFRGGRLSAISAVRKVPRHVLREGATLALPKRALKRAALAAEANFLGDIAISPATARRNAKKYDRTLPSELQILILHGVLHLLGYDHETDSGQMTRIEHRLRRKLGLS
jgi:probable rRNA maturation factor